MSDERLGQSTLTDEQQAIFSKHIKALHQLWNKYGWPSDAVVGETEALIVEQIRQGLVS